MADSTLDDLIADHGGEVEEPSLDSTSRFGYMSGPVPAQQSPQSAVAKAPAQDLDALVKQFGGKVDAPDAAASWKPNPNDRRADGSLKGRGFLGALNRKDGKVSSEISIGVEIDGKEVEVPTLVPTLTAQEKSWLLDNDVSDPKKIPRSIIIKATDFARGRIKEGKSPFAQDGEGPAAPGQPADVDALLNQFGGVEEAPPEPPKAPAVSAAMPGAATPPKQKSFFDRLGEIGDTEAGFADIASPAATAILKSPVTGAQQVIKGAGEVLPTLTAVLKTSGEADLGGKLTPPKIDVENVKAGVSDILEGVGQMATIPTLVAGVANPVAVGRVVISTFLAGGAAKTVAKYAGASESTQRFMEDVAAGAVAMGVTAFEVGKMTGEGLAKLAERGKAARAAADAEAAATNQGFKNAKQTPGVRTDRALPSNTPLPPAPTEARPVAPEPPSTAPLALTPDVQARAIEVLKDESASADDKQTATVALRRAGLSDEQIAAAVEPGEALKAVPAGDDVKAADVEEAIEAHGGVDETPTAPETGRVATLQKANGIPFSEAKQLADLETRVTTARDANKADVGAETALKDLRDKIETRTGKPLEMGPVSKPEHKFDRRGFFRMVKEAAKGDFGEFVSEELMGDPAMIGDFLTDLHAHRTPEGDVAIAKSALWLAENGLTPAQAMAFAKYSHKALGSLGAIGDIDEWVKAGEPVDYAPPKSVSKPKEGEQLLSDDPDAFGLTTMTGERVREFLGVEPKEAVDRGWVVKEDNGQYRLIQNRPDLTASGGKPMMAAPVEKKEDHEETARKAFDDIKAKHPMWEVVGTDDAGKWVAERTDASDGRRSVGDNRKDREPPKAVQAALDVLNALPEDVVERVLNESARPVTKPAKDAIATSKEVADAVDRNAATLRNSDLQEQIRSLDKELGHPWGDRDDFAAMLDTDPADLNEHTLRSTLKELEAMKPKASAAKEESGPKVTYNTAQRSVEVKFATKPEREVLDKLKANGFKWAKTNQHWYRRSPSGSPENNIAVVKNLLGQTSETPKTEPVKKAEVGGYDREAAQKTFKGFRTALTRATNAARANGLTREQKIEKLHVIVAEAKRFNDYYESSAEPWPDYHNDWVRAGEDAEHQIKRLEAENGTFIPGLTQVAISKGAAADSFESGDRVRYNGLSFVVADPQREGDWLRLRDPKGGDLHLVDGRKVEYISKTPEEQGLKTEGFITNTPAKKTVTPQVDAPAGSTPLGLKPKEATEAKKLSDYKPGEEVIYKDHEGKEFRGTVLDPTLTGDKDRLRVDSQEQTEHGAAYKRMALREGDVRPADKVYEYSSTQVDLDGELRDKVLALGKKIPKPDLADEGLEKEPHVTIKFGLHALGREEITDAFKGTEPFNITLGDVAYFSGKDGDVLHIQVESQELHALNEKIGALPNSDEHPEYQPHITIAYLKPGKGKVYVQKDVFDSLKGQTFHVNAITTSLATGKKWVSPLIDKDTQEYLATPPGKRRIAVDDGGNALEQALSPKAQEALAAMFKERNRSKDLRHIREAMEVYERLLDMQTDEGFADAGALREATEIFFLDQTREKANDVDAAAHKGLQTITGEEDPDPAELLENEVFASAKEAGDLIFNTLDPKTAAFDVEEFNTAFGDVEFRRDQDDVFPRPQQVVNDHLKTGKDVISIEAAKKIVDGWKAEAKRIGKDEDHSNEVIYSLFDVTGEWSAPWRDAGYLVRQFDIKSGQDLMDFGSWMDTVEEDLAEGREIVGIIGAPPCTSFAVSGARWWKSQHDIADTSMVAKKYGLWASEHFERPLDYANHLVAVMKLIVEQADPRDFYAMENPIGRIAEQNALPKPTLVFDPANFGDPYTKQTQIWGDFNPDLPMANVEPTLGSLMHQLRGDVEEDKAKRSETPEGFAYAFFMANHKPAKAKDGEVGDRYASDESTYAGEKLSDLLPTVEEEQRGRLATIEALRAERDKAPMGGKKREALTKELKELTDVYTSTYDEVEMAAGSREAEAMIVRVQGTMWSKNEAESLLSDIEDSLETAGFSAEIVGGVGKRGESLNDLDIVLRPTKPFKGFRDAEEAFIKHVAPQLTDRDDLDTDIDFQASHNEPGQFIRIWTTVKGTHRVSGEGKVVEFYLPDDLYKGGAKPAEGRKVEEGTDAEPPVTGATAKAPQERPASSGETGAAGPERRAGGRLAAPQRGAGAKPHPGRVEPGEGEGDGAGGSVPGDHGSVGGGRKVRAAVAKANKAPSLSPDLYQITDADAIGTGSRRERVQRNLAAIRIIKQLQAEDRLATVDERKALVQYVGWGGLPRIFEYWKNDPDDPDPDDQWWQAQHTALSELLSRDEYATARNSTQNAHYTSPVVIRAMWDAVRHLGVKNGSALEPAAGIGHFLGLAPDDLRQMAFATVEKDEMSAAITKALYPGAFNQQSPFEEATLPDDHFTVAISNVPFGLIPITDRAWSGPAYVPRRIHNYFFGKALTKVAPGGLVAFISSHGTLDARDDTGHRVREYLSSKADFLGAIRLPYTAFKGNAGTEVITDIIFLRKRFPGEVEAHVSPWLESKQIELPAKNGENITQWSNEYMIDHPEMVLGTPASTGKMRAKAEHHTEGGQHYNVEPIKGRDLADQLAEAVKLLPMNAIDTAPSKESLSSFVETQAPLGSRPFEYLIHDGQLAQNIDGRAVAVEMSKADENRVRGLLPIRSAVRELYDLMAADADDAAITKAQKTLNVAYDKFVKGHGPISSSENFEAFREDPDLPLLLSLEDYDEERGTAAKNAVFTQRTMKAERKLRTAASPDQALSISLGETGKIDLDRIGELLGQGPEQAADTLQTANLIIDTPSGWQLPITYLSGNVRVKHAEATAAAAMNPRYQAAADKLKAVIPEDRPAHKIRVRLGAAWVPVPMVKEFIDSIVIGRGADSWTVTYTASDAKWNIDGPPSAHSSKFQIPDVDTKTMLLDALNDRRRVVKSRVPNPNGEGTVVRIDRKATALARQRKEDLSKAFQDWLLKDDATRKEWTVRTYNDLFHSYVEPKVDGAYLTFPGMADFWRERMSWWQRNAVSRILLFGNTLLAHVVGAGKTLEMVSAIMELRRSGLARKPMMVVPNHLISQAPSEFLQYYPNAKVLVATPEDLNAESRKRFTARIAAGSYDAIIVPYSAFVRISMSAEAEMKYQRELLDDIELAIIKAWADAQESETNKGGRSRRGKGGKLPPQVKTLENMRDRIQARLKKLEERPKDDMLSFEQLGVDALFIDEAHSFKNLYFPTRHANVSGIPADNDVQRATDLYLKSRYINALSGHRNLVLATGTPVTNSMAEVFVMQKLLQEHALERAQINQFDAWLAQFGKIVAETTLDPSGTGMSARPVLKKFNNLVDLAAMFRQVADVKMIDDLPELKARRPKLRGGKIEQVLVPMTAQQRALMTTLKDRADHLDPKDRRADNMPKITTDGRMGMLDMRLLDRRRPEEKGNKLSKVADNVASIWKEWKAKKGTQLVFLDSGTPNSEKNSDKPRKAYNPDTGETTMRPPTEAERNRGFNLYGDLKKKLVKAGIPVEQIAFIHDIDAVPEKRQDAARKALFRKVREGEIRVLIGSTKKMGTGMNVQDRLVALHHVEPTWTPDGIEQRNGRILRQGNLFFKEDPEHFDVRILNYLTTGEGNAFGFDAYMWQLNERKAGIISDFFSGDLQDKDYDLDLNQTVLTAGEMKAVATGNPKVIEFGKLQGDLERLELTKAGFEDAQREASYKLSAWEEALARDQRVYDREKETAAAITPIGDEQEATFGEGKDAEVVTGAKNVGDRILAEAKKLVTPTKGHPGPWKSYVQPKWIGSYHGLEMTIEGNGTTEPWLVLRHPQDDPPRYSENRPDQQYASVRFALMKPDPQGPGGQNWIESTTGLMMRVGNQVDNMRHPSTSWIDRDKDEIAAAQGALKGKFDQQDELMQTRLKVEELARELGLPLDNMGAEVTNEELDVDGETPPDDDTEPKTTKHKMLAVDDDFGEPSFARTESGRIKAGVGDEGAAARIMASSLYSKGIGGVAVKELFQNAVDAIRGVVDGAIVVKIGNIHGGEDPFVEVSDNGPGLTKEELETVFTDLFSSGKREQAGAAGGFGIAKASFLLGGKHVRVQTVVAQRGKGFFGKAEKVQYAFEATPEELTDPAGVHVTVTTMPADTPTGTIVRTTMPKDTSTYQGQSFIEDVLKYSPALPGTVTLDLGYHKKTYEPKERERAFAGYTRHELSVPGATLRLMISPKLDESTALMLKVANNGIYQMNAAVGTADPKKAEFMGPKLLMPEHVLVDVRALVPEGDPLYPFTANREEVRDDFAKAMRAAIFEDIIRPIRERSQTLLQDTYDKMATVAIGPRAVPILDSGKRMTDAELAALFAAPAVQRAVGAVLDVTRKVLDRVLGKDAAQVERVGILLDSKTHGVFIPNPRTMKSDTEARRATVLINPFQALQTEPTPDAMGAMMYHVAVHEAVHWHVGGHNEAFTVKLGDEFRKLGARFEIENLKRIMEAYAGGNLDNIDEEIAIALHRYSDARQRPVVEEDALSRTGHNLGRSADDGGAEAGDADRAGSDRAGGVAPHEMLASDKDALQAADTAIGKSKASIITIFGQAPAQDDLVRHGFRTWRQRIAELEQRHTHAVFALKKMEAAFDRIAAGADGDPTDPRVQRVRERILRIADALEDPEGTGAELPHELQAWAAVRDELFELEKAKQDALGVGLAWRDYYLGHIWQNNRPGAIDSMMAWMRGGKRPIEGPKTYRKRRTIPTMREGVEQFGKEPEDWNLVRVDLAKLQEMRKFTAAATWLERDLKPSGAAVFRSALSPSPDPSELRVLPGRFFEVWAPPTVEVREAFDYALMHGLESVMDQMGIPYTRVPDSRRAWGTTEIDKDTGQILIQAKFGGPVDVLQHELGHALDERYKLSQLFPAAEYGEELEALAKLRHSLGRHSDEFREYVQTKPEQIANLVYAYLHAPEELKRVAPKTAERFEEFIDSVPVLAGMLPDLQNMRSLVMGERSTEKRLPGPVLVGRYYAPVALAKAAERYLQPGLGAHPAWKIIRWPVNALVQWTLAWPMFHFFTVTGAAMADEGAQGLQSLMAGHPVQGLRKLIQAPLAPILAGWAGTKVQDVYRDSPDVMAGAVLDETQTLIMGGGRALPSAEYSNRQMKAVMQNIRTAHGAWEHQLPKTAVGAALKAAFHLVPAAIEAAAWMIMDKYVPMVKAGSITRGIATDLANLKGIPTPETLRAIATKRVNQADALYGQVIWDNMALHVNRAVMNAMQLLIMAPGWRGGALVIALRAAADPLWRLKHREQYRLQGGGGTGGGGGKPPKDGKGEKEPLGDDGLPPYVHEPWFSSYLALFVMISVVGAAFAELWQLAHGAGHIQSPKDVAAPRDGSKDSDGKPHRDRFPGYQAIFYEMLNHLPFSLLKYTLGGDSPLPKMMTEWYHNENQFGGPIWDPGDTFGNQLAQYVRYLKTHLPIAVSSYQRAETPEQKRRALLYSASPASRAITDTPAEALMRQYAPPRKMSQDDADKLELKKAIRAGSPEDADAAINSGDLSGQEIINAIESGAMGTSADEVRFKQLPYGKALKVYKVASPEERAVFFPILVERLDKAVENSSPNQMQSILDEFNAAMELPVGK